MPLDLLVPDLLLPADAPPTARSTRLPSAERWLARADIARHPARSAAAWLFDAYGVDGSGAAAISRVADAGSAEGTWMRADPVHLVIQGDTVRLRDASVLDVRIDEARALSAALQAHFAGDGLEFHAATPQRWYVKLSSGEAPRTTSLDDAVGRNVFGLLPAEPWWRSAMTEAQMILSGHEVNARREEEGRPAINSVWFWGGGALPAPSRKPYALVCARDALARGLGLLSGAQVQDLPENIAGVDVAREDEHVLVAVTDLPRETIDAKWFAELAGALERFDRVRAVLPSAGDTKIATFTRSSRWRWFRASKPLSAYA
jgi:hypothetical protein